MRALFAIIRNDFIICMHFRFDPIYAHGSSGYMILAGAILQLADSETMT